MDPKELAALMKMPEPAYPAGKTPIRDPRGSGWSYVPPAAYSEMQMAEYALAHKLFERDEWRRILAARDEDDRHEEIRYQTLRAAAKLALAALCEERSQYGEPLAHVEEAIAALQPLVGLGA